MGAEIRAEGARETAKKAIREADRAKAEAWSIRMEGYVVSFPSADFALYSISARANRLDDPADRPRPYLRRAVVDA